MISNISDWQHIFKVSMLFSMLENEITFKRGKDCRQSKFKENVSTSIPLYYVSKENQLIFSQFHLTYFLFFVQPNKKRDSLPHK